MTDEHSEGVTRVVIVGAGPGGYAAAFRAADLGMEVTMIDTEPNPGGVCLYRGCIPSKALLHVSKLIHEASQASEWGLDFGTPQIDLERLRIWKGEVVERLTGGLGLLSNQRKIEYLQGRGKFFDDHTVHVDLDGEVTVVPFDYAIIATGSAPSIPDPLQVNSPLVMDSTAALQVESMPDRLLVVGGGYIGLELGTVYAALGSRVRVVEMTPGLLPGVDRDLVEPLATQLKGKFEDIMLDTKVTKLSVVDDVVRAHLLGADLDEEQTFDRVLIAVGRRPNSADLGLESTSVQVDERGFIVTDRYRRTAEASIFAIGDVAGEPMLAHKATHEGHVAAEAIAGHTKDLGPSVIPAVVFTDPEVAWCGVTETEAVSRGLEFEVQRFPWAASGRAATIGRHDGFSKLIVDPQTERILGVGIVGAGAGELIAEGTLAVESGALANDIRTTIHAHPTLGETLMEAAELFFGHATHFMSRPRRVQR